MHPFILEAGVVAAAEVTTLKTEPVPNGHMFTALSVVAMDEDSAIATYIMIGIASGTKLIPVDSTPGAFAALTSMTIYWPFMLAPGQAVFAKFATPSAGDHLTLIAHGVLAALEEPTYEERQYHGDAECHL